MYRSRAYLRKEPIAPYRQKFLWGLIPVPGSEARNPPLNHHGVDLAAIRKKMELNRASIQKGRVIFPGLGVSKHPMTIVTSAATYVVGWASCGGNRAIAIVGEAPVGEGRILFLDMGEPMVFTGPGGMVCVTAPVVFIGRRIYNQIRTPELSLDGHSRKSIDAKEMPRPALQSPSLLRIPRVLSKHRANGVDGPMRVRA